MLKKLLFRFSGLPSKLQIQQLLAQRKADQSLFIQRCNQYEEAVKAISFRNYKQALRLLQAVKSYARKQKLFSGMNSIMRSEAGCLLRLGATEQSQKILKENLHRNQQNKNILNTYICYQDLLNFYLENDLRKVILLARSLTSSTSLQFPVSFLRYFEFVLGTAYLLDQNFVDAKKRLATLISSSPNQHIKSMSQNNLALALAWEGKSDERHIRELLVQAFGGTLQQNERADWMQAIEQQSLSRQVCMVYNFNSLRILQNLLQFSTQRQSKFWMGTILRMLAETKSQYRGRAHLLAYRFYKSQKDPQSQVFRSLIDSQDDFMQALLQSEEGSTSLQGYGYWQPKLLYVCRDSLI